MICNFTHLLISIIRDILYKEGFDNMTKKTELETMEKLKKLSLYMGSSDDVKDKPQAKEPKVNKDDKPKPQKQPKKTKPTFKTSEVVILMLITILISLIFGSFFGAKLFNSRGEKVESELQNFINDYQYIIDNYNGKIDKKKLLEAALQGMLGELDDNSIFLDKNNAKNFNINLQGSYVGVGIEIFNNDEGEIEINRVLDNSPAAKQGLKTGDVIVKYNNEDIAKMNIDKFVSKVEKSKSKTINLTYRRSGELHMVKLNIGEINLKSVSAKTFNKDNKKIGYLYISIFASNTGKQFKEQLTKLQKTNIDALIIDLRFNSGGYLAAAENILSQFLDSSHPIYQIQKGEKITKHYSRGSKTMNMDIAILVNGNSASASEVVASALSEQLDALIIGEKTFGKGTVQELQDLTDGDKFKITTKNWLTSKGKWLDKKGLEPDIEVKLSDEYMNNPDDNHDNQLQTALTKLSK